MPRRYTHVIGFDDAPFDPAHRGDVLVVGAYHAGSRLEGVLSGKIRRDGANATPVLAGLLHRSRFAPQLHLVLLQGIAFGGFNVVDLTGLHEASGIPIIAVMRRRPDFARIHRALLDHVPGGARKWRLIQRAGPVEPAGSLHIQRAGIALDLATTVIEGLCTRGALPEPLRTAHLIAGGIAAGESRHRA